MKTSREIIDTLGRNEIVARIGVDMRRVNRAAYEEKLPALWYAALSDMAGKDLPRELFSFKGMNGSKSGSNAASGISVAP